MKKSTLLFILLLIGLGGYFAYDSKWGKTMLTGVVSEDLKVLREESLSFMEDIRYKDFTKAATYHHPDKQKEVDIPKLIEKMFKIKPEFLDIMEYDIMEATLDSSKKRGRVKIKAKVNLLNSGEIKNPEIMLYFYKEGEQWFMKLESSLR